MATHFGISYGKWRQPCHIGAAQSRLTNPARVARRQDCDSHQKLVLIRSGALRLEILFEVSYPAPALFNGGRVDGSFRRTSADRLWSRFGPELPHCGNPASTASTEALPFLLKSLIPSSHTTAAMLDSDSTSRSSRSLADGPPGNGFCGEYSAGPTTWLPPMPAFTTATLLP